MEHTDAKTFLLARLPRRIRSAVERVSKGLSLSELRLRRGGAAFIVTPAGNTVVTDEEGKPLLCSAEELTTVLASLCDGCCYRYFDTLTRGFLTLDNGIRIGLAGEKRGDFAHLAERLSSLNLRLPVFSREAADAYLIGRGTKPPVSALVLSPPGGGKTTFLRALALRLSEGTDRFGPMRVAVVDERREFFPAAAGEGVSCDVIASLDKAEGIERAVRLFSPQILICDEIGGAPEARALSEAGRCGVVFFASLHAADAAEALSRPSIRELVAEGVFREAVIIRPVPGRIFQAKIRTEALS